MQTDRDLCYLFRCLYKRGPVDPPVQLLIIFSLAGKNMVLITSGLRLIAGVLLQFGVSDWPAVEIIAKPCCLRN